jgi:DNA (cytosine-5)-methyltransferase 1
MPRIEDGYAVPLPVLSLFSGAGGLDLGFEDCGFLPLLALDNDPAAVETYNWNRREAGEPARIADLAAVDPATIVAWWREQAGGITGPVGVIGGPPCQAFSVSNVHKLEDDLRARLPLAYARILTEFNMRFPLDFFLFENVAGLGHRPHRSSLEAFMTECGKAGFNVKSFCLDAVRFRVPQYRNRMFIVGFNSSRHNASDFLPPAGDNVRSTVREAIYGLPEPQYFSRSRRPEEVGLHPNHWCMNPRSPKFRNGALSAGAMLGRPFRMLKWCAPSWTVAYGHREVHVHPNGTRRLSVYEAMRLQALPPDYELRGTLSDQFRLVSDAVPPPLAHALALAIRDFVSRPATVVRLNEHPLASGHSEQVGLLGVQTVAPRSTSE